ncbi:MAG: insulinase family protein [Flavobacteriales bacterium]|nr:insulinase family protein [Flavobacteriales bacterium]
MIEFNKYTLSNGLRVLIHQDHTTPLAAMNIVYDVGARDEHPEKTGFAHLFEHLMFEGSKNIPNYDTPLQLAGGSNNAFTSNDVTNYYLTVPASNIEVGFWLESDRMLELAFSKEKLDVQKKVVSEEFKQRYLNQPYGDIWLLARPLIYKKHPYQWATIGKDLSHIEKATLEDVKDFFYKFYAPNNAVLVISGNVETSAILQLAEKWFGPIPRRNVPKRNLPQEPPQTEERRLRVERDVPSDALLMAFHMPSRTDERYYAFDLLTDILSGGKSSRLYEKLVKEKEIFTEIGAYVMGSHDPGLIIVFGKLEKKITIAQGEAAVWELLEEIKQLRIADEELAKVKNKWLTQNAFEQLSVLNKAMKLSFAELLGDAQMVNREPEIYASITVEQIQQAAAMAFQKNNCSILEYKSLQI